jgi:hypothetical protein
MIFEYRIDLFLLYRSSQPDVIPRSRGISKAIKYQVSGITYRAVAGTGRALARRAAAASVVAYQNGQHQEKDYKKNDIWQPPL